SHLIMLSVNLSGMKDYNSYYGEEAAGRDIHTAQYLLNYNVSFPVRLLSLFTSLSHTSLEGAGTQTRYSGVTLGGNYKVPRYRLQAGANASLMRGTMPTGKNTILNGSLNLNYSISKIQSLRASFFLTNNNPGSVVTGTNPAFTETRAELAYQINFGL